ncbi:acyltransferase family protein [Olsenella sp. AGMB03486]|uniref:acyltransferase family protein n=1 Tax=Olsenella sp. AGMB03486 TaxID=3230364 RepID=UPI0034A0330E
MSQQMKPAAAQAGAGRASASKKPYVASLDGLRALCALGVVFYHMGLGWCQGGLLGVTVLFVLSGYLAMGGLLHEFEKTGTIASGKYYLKRIKRLLPTSVVYVVVCAAACTLLSHQLLTKMRPDIVPSLLMVLNWYKIFSNQSYFAAAGAPSPLTHFWSLAIEFQFYLILPPVLCLLLRKKVQKKHLAIGLGVLTVASAVAMALLFVPGADPSRAYYGTDTRAQSLLLGCLLAIIWPFDKMSAKAAGDFGQKKRLGLELAGAASVVALLLMMRFTEGYTSFTYYGGTLLISAIAAVAIAALTPSGTAAAKVLSWGPLAWIGKRSFAIYVWHYLIVQLMASHNAALSLPWWQVVVELLLTFIAAELSYALVEMPLRRHTLRAVIRRDFVRRKKDRERAVREQKPCRGVSRKVHAALLKSPVKVPQTICAAAVIAIAVFGLILVPPENAMGGTNGAQQVSAATLKKPLVDGVYDVVFIGDSVSLGASTELNASFPHGVVDSAVGRQASEALDVYNSYASTGVVGNTVIFSIGSNGYLDEDTLEAIYEAVGTDKELWFVNDRTPRDWCTANNDLLASFAAEHENVGVIDWYGTSANESGWFWDDGTHLRPEAAQNFADLVVSTIGYEIPTEENTTYSVLFLGDATSMQAADKLAAAWPQGMVDCAAGRTVDALKGDWEGYVGAGTAGSRVVVALPTDVPLTKEGVDALLDSIGSERQIWLVNGRSNAAFCDSNNQIIADEASSRSNVQLIDWYSASEGQSGWFTSDGASLTDEGVAAYAQTVIDAVGDVSGTDEAADAAKTATEGTDATAAGAAA